MFVIKLKPVVTLAVQWDGTNLEEVKELFHDVEKSYDNSLAISDNNGSAIVVPLNWFAIKYENTVLALDVHDFLILCKDYFNPHETTEEEDEDNRPDPDFITFM